jgi:hypothetical protein
MQGSTIAGAQKDIGSLFYVDTAGQWSLDKVGSAWASVAVGVYFRPAMTDCSLIPVDITMPLRWKGSYDDWSRFSTAHDDGYLDILIQSVDLNGNDLQTVVDERTQLWSDGTSWLDHNTESFNWFKTLEAQFNASQDRQYLCWAWASGSCDGSTDDAVPSGSQGTFSATVDYVTIDQG